MTPEIDPKFEEKLTCGCQIPQLNEEFGNFSPEHLKVWKLELSWGSFIQSKKCTSLKFTGELCVMAVKNDVFEEFEKELTCQFKINRRNLTKFNPSTQKSQKFAL